MSQATRLETLNMDSETTIAQLTQRLTYHGLRIVRGFDLKSASVSFGNLTCSHHGDFPCDCQMVVLLVYSANSEPASIVLHSHRGKTGVDLVNSPNNYPGQQLIRTIQLVLEKILESTIYLNTETNAT